MRQWERIMYDDEISFGPLHMERMSDEHIWFRIGDATFDLYAVGGKLAWVPQNTRDSWQRAEEQLEESYRWDRTDVKSSPTR